MAFRFPIRIPKTLDELFGWLRELLPQLEIKVLKDRQIETTTTAIAHGLGSVPVFVRTSNPHCISIIRKAKAPDKNCVYLRATNKVVADVWVASIGAIGESLVKNGGYHYQDWDPEGDALGDHKFSVDAADETADGYDYAETKLVGSSTVALTKVTGSHGKAIQFTAANQDDHLVKARNADATTVGGLMEKTIDSDTITRELTTDGGVEKVRFNAAPATPPAGEGSWLYTGSIQASNLLDPVKAFVKAAEGSTTISAGTDVLWNVLENGDIERKEVGQLYGLDPTGSETFTLSEGQRVFCAFTSTTNTRAGGTCTVLTLGDASTKAVLHPVAGEMVTGNMFEVDGVGAEYEGWYWEIDAEDPVTYWIYYRPDYHSTTTYPLFTSTQVSQAGSTTRETSVTIPGGTSGGTMFAIPYFEMLDVLGVSTIPKGVVNWEIKAYVVADDPAATVFVRAFLTTDLGILDRFGYGDTPPIHNTSAVVLDCQGTISADRTVNPSSRLGAVFYGYSDSASEVTIKLVYNDASHSTRVQTPLTTASFGTLDHGLLTPVSRKFPNTDQGRADAVEWAHPQDGIQPGRIQTPANPNVTSVDGLFAVPLDSNFVVLEGTEDLIGCSTEGWTGPGWIEVHILNERDILKSQSPLPDGYAPFMWGSTDTGYGADYDVQTAYAGSIFRFRWTGGVWRIAGVMNM